MITVSSCGNSPLDRERSIAYSPALRQEVCAQTASLLQNARAVGNWRCGTRLRDKKGAIRRAIALLMRGRSCSLNRTTGSRWATSSCSLVAFATGARRASRDRVCDRLDCQVSGRQSPPLPCHGRRAGSPPFQPLTVACEPVACHGAAGWSDASLGRRMEASEDIEATLLVMVVAGPANCQCCGEEADFLYIDPQSVAGGLPARNLCEECRDKQRRGSRLPCEPEERALIYTRSRPTSRPESRASGIAASPSAARMAIGSN
jgi:hypothetical protein